MTVNQAFARIAPAAIKHYRKPKSIQLLKNLQDINNKNIANLLPCDYTSYHNRVINLNNRLSAKYSH